MCKFCNVLICQNCIDEVSEPDYILENNITCHECKNILNVTDIQKITRRGLEMLHVRCPSNNINCFDYYKIKDLSRHLETCKFYEGKSKCNFCGLIDKTNKIKTHMDTCKEIPIPCRFCEENIERKNIPEHEETCYKKPKNCKTCKMNLEENKENDHEPTKDFCMLYLVNEISEKLESN